MSTQENSFGLSNQQNLYAGKNNLNATSFLFWSLLARVRTATLVKVVAVTSSGADAPAGFVDVHPLINQVDGAGNPTPHGTVHHLPYFRLQGGANAVILDPQVGDIGLAAFCDRDISAVVATRAQANPGSGRVFDFADGLYVGGFLGQTPTQFISFSASGIKVISPVEIDLSAPVVRVHASTSLHLDADGNGTVFTPTSRTDYSIGSTTTTEPINPPQVP